MRGSLNKRSETVFNLEVKEVSALIKRRMDDYALLLFGLRGFLNASEEVSYSEWINYCSQLNLTERIAGIHSISFSEYFERAEKDIFIRRVRNDRTMPELGLPDFAIYTRTDSGEIVAPERAEYCVTRFVWPWEENKKALGLELCSLPRRYQLLNEIRDTGAPGMSARLSIANHLSKDIQGFIVYLPVYESLLSSPETILQRRAALRGFVAAAFRADILIANILGEFSRYPNIDLEVYDGETPDVGKLHYNDDDQIQAIDSGPAPRFSASSVQRTFGRSWLLYFSATDEFHLESVHEALPVLTLILGIALSSIIAISFFVLITSRDRAVYLAEKINKQYEQQRALSIRSDRLRSLGQMAAGIAHELNQPLVGVRGLAEHVLIGKERGWEMDEKTVRDKISLIVDQADRMSHIIEHIRIFAREAGKPELRRVSVNDVVESSTDLLGAQFASHGLVLTTQLADGLPEVMANPFSLEEVLLNLITNGRDAVETRMETEPDLDSAEVALRTGTVKQDGKLWVQIVVTDKGVGIPENILSNIFDPFFTTKEPDRGTGLGLAISKTIIEEFGGQLQITSIPHTKTTATIWLPAAE